MVLLDTVLYTYALALKKINNKFAQSTSRIRADSSLNLGSKTKKFTIEKNLTFFLNPKRNLYS